MRRVSVNPVEARPFVDCDAEPFKAFGTNKNSVWKIAVLNGGFVIVGQATLLGPWLQLDQASVVREWGSHYGLGEIAETGPIAGTVLDNFGKVRTPLSSVIALIDCEDEKWNEP